MMMNVSELNRASSQRCQPHTRLLASGSLCLGSSRKSGLGVGRGGAGSVCLPSDLGCCPLPGGARKGRGRGRDRGTSFLKGQEPWLLGGASWWGVMSRSVKGHFPGWGLFL